MLLKENLIEKKYDVKYNNFCANLCKIAKKKAESP